MKKINIVNGNIKSIGKTWLKCIGTFASMLSVFFLFCTWEDLNIESLQERCLVMSAYCIVGLAISIIWVCGLKKSKTIWESASGKIKVCYLDIMKDGFDNKNRKEKLFVIPVNSCFDTIVDNDISKYSKPLISPNSLHGKWINKMIHAGFDKDYINKKIQKSLEKQKIEPINTISQEDKERGKRKVYNLGTIATVRGKNNNTFLLLSVCEFNKNNIAHTSIEELESCIKSLINFYDEHGQGHTLIVPLIGTNFSRAGLSHNDSLRIITSLFQLYGDKIHGEIQVAIYNGDKDKVTLDAVG